MPEVTIHYGDKTNKVTLQGNMTLLQLLQQQGVPLNSPCNGKGTCGKCRVQILRPAIAFSREEEAHLSAAEMQQGIHLSCRVKVREDMEVNVGTGDAAAAILTEAKTSELPVAPVLCKFALQPAAPSLEDQRSDAERVLSAYAQKARMQLHAFNGNFPALSPEILRQLPSLLREKEYQVTAVSLMDQITGLETGNTSKTLYGVAVDIGTTTLAAYLYDLNSGDRLAVASMLNPQKKYGADVISRIDYAAQSDAHAEEMADLIRMALNTLILRLTQSYNLDKLDVYLVTLAGNTTMLHLLLKLPSLQLAKAPFIPVTLSTQFIKPSELNLEMNPYGRIILLPGVSAYVGADTVAAVLSTGICSKHGITLLVDIGTNGEIVLGGREFLLACSTAAGPAFEGANITCGTGGIEGAVSEVYVDALGELQIKTIGEQKAIGICGSGLIDAIACMLEIGILDDTGRILDRSELEGEALKHSDRLFTLNGQPAFSLAQAEGIYITQKDVREVQNAKAAIAAGIAILLREAGLKVQDIHSVFLAGGFGSFMRIHSALVTGLLPKIPIDRITAVGNAAGAGAIEALLSKEKLFEAMGLPGRIKYLELSSRQDFVLEYTEQLFFDIP